MKKVRANSLYVYEPVLMDLCDPPYGIGNGMLKPGDTVKVVRMHGCPPPNAMGMAHIGTPDYNPGAPSDKLKGRFLGLVCTGSLRK